MVRKASRLNVRRIAKAFPQQRYISESEAVSISCINNTFSSKEKTFSSNEQIFSSNKKMKDVQLVMPMICLQ